MDVNNAIKVNKLARELLKHGIVNSLEEGVGEASKHVEREVIADSTIKPVNEEKKMANLNEEEQGDAVRMLERKLNYLAKSVAEQFNAEMGAMKKEIGSLKDEISSLKRNLQTVSAQSRQAAAPQPQKTLSGEDAPPVLRKKKDDDFVKPRTGDLTPDDIDLDNIFYCGNKR